MNDNKIMQTIQFRGEEISLEASRGKYTLRAKASQRSVEVTSQEGTQLLNFSADELDRAMQLCGLSFDEESRESDRRRAVTSIRSQLPRGGHFVLLDTTTLENAVACLERGSITPLSLLDLGVLTFAALCFDRIVIQPYGTWRFVNRRLPNLFHEITYPDKFIPGTLWSLCAGLYNDLSSEGRLSQTRLEAAWGRFLNVEPSEIKLNLYAWDRHQNSPYAWDGIFASHYHDYLESLSARNNRRSRDEFLSIQTMRLLFNDKLAGYLNLPYLASSLRSCVYSEVISRKLQTRLLIDKLLASVGPATAEPGGDDPYTSEVSAPFLLGLVLQQMTKPEDYWNILQTYRDRFAPLRQKISADRERWDGRSGAYLKSYTTYLEDFLWDDRKEALKKGEDVIEASVAAGVALATASQQDTGLVGLGFKLAKLLKISEKLLRLYLKQFKPEIYILLSLSDEARQLQMVEHRVRTIWGETWTREQRDQLEWLAASHPGEFLRLRDVG